MRNLNVIKIRLQYSMAVSVIAKQIWDHSILLQFISSAQLWLSSKCNKYATQKIQMNNFPGKRI